MLFCDDDVRAAPGWLAAHAAAHGEPRRVVNGPILNVPAFDARPKPRRRNYSRAFLCTCNASLPKEAFVAVGGFDERFDLYGWEDTELGVRLREPGCAGSSRGMRTSGTSSRRTRTRSRSRRARRSRRREWRAVFSRSIPSRRARLATGAHRLNLLRARYLLPDWLLAIYAGVSTSERAPAWVAAVGRAQFLDGIYARELVRALDAAGG